MFSQFLDSFPAKIVVWLSAALLAYGAARGDISVLQAKYDFVQQQLTEIKLSQSRVEAKVDRILEGSRDDRIERRNYQNSH